MAGNETVQWPSDLVDEKGSDLGHPLHNLLHQMDLIGTDADESKTKGAGAAFDSPPASIAILEAGATAATKWWSAGMTALAAAGLTLELILAKATGFFNGQGAAVRATIIAGSALVVAAVVIAVAVMIQADLRARGQGMAATYQARASVAEAFIAEAARLPQPQSDAAPAGQLALRDVAALLGAAAGRFRAQPKGHGVEEVAGFRYHDGKVEVRIGESYYDFDALEYFEADGALRTRVLR
jgi:hypothetical protein